MKNQLCDLKHHILTLHIANMWIRIRSPQDPEETPMMWTCRTQVLEELYCGNVLVHENNSVIKSEFVGLVDSIPPQSKMID